MNDLLQLLENPRVHVGDDTLAAAHRHILNIYREAVRPRSALKGLLKDGSSLASVLGVSIETVKRMSRVRLSLRIEAAHIALPSQQGFEDRLARFTEDFGLDAAERALLGLAALSEACDALNEVFDELEGFVARDLALLASHATGVDVRALRSALSPQGLLVSSGLVSIERYGSLSSRLSLLEGVAVALNENAPAGPLAARFMAAAPASKLDFDDYGHHAEDVSLIRAVLEGALRTRATGVHVLLHGAPGTGKSELARLVAHSAGQAFEVPDAERDGGALAADKRLRRYTFLLRLLASGGGRVLVFDEVEELLGSFEQAGWVASGHGATAMHKSWKNRLLETAAVPTI